MALVQQRQQRPGILGQLGDVGGQLLGGLNPIPMAQGAYWSMLHPLDRMTMGGDMMLPVGKGAGFRTGPSRGLGDRFRQQDMLDMWRDTQKDIQQPPTLPATRQFVMERMADANLRKFGLDREAARRARMDQVASFLEDVESLNMHPGLVQRIGQVDPGLTTGMAGLRGSLRRGMDEGTITSQTPGAADHIDFVRRGLTNEALNASRMATRQNQFGQAQNILALLHQWEASRPAAAFAAKHDPESYSAQRLQAFQTARDKLKNMKAVPWRRPHDPKLDNYPR